MTSSRIQDRTVEFRAVVQQAQRRQAQSVKGGSGGVGGGGAGATAQKKRATMMFFSNGNEQSEPLLDAKSGNGSNAQGPPSRSEFARRAAGIGRGIASTMAKLERLAMLAKRKSLFDDKSTEVNELTFVVKQNLANLNQQISDLQSLTRQQTGKTEEGEHQKNVVFLLQDRLTGVSGNFKDVLEVRTKNLQATRARTDNFISQVSQNVAPLNPAGLHAQSSSPFYHASTPGSASAGRNTPILDGSGGSLTSAANNGDAVLSLNPVSDQQQMLMEEAQPINMYTQERGEAIEAIQSTIAELGSIFGQLASMVTEQSEMIERIDANAEDVVDNVEGAQKQLLKYWGRVSSNRWLIAKMFGVLMIFFLLWVLIAG